MIPNTAPFFKDDPMGTIILPQITEGETYELVHYVLPDTIDSNTTQVITVSVFNLEASFMKYDMATTTLTFDPNKIPQNELGTSKKLEIEVKDDMGAKRTYYIIVSIPKKKEVVINK